MDADKFRAFLSKASAALDLLFPAEIVINGLAYPCTSSGRLRDEKAVDGGFYEDSIIRARVSKEKLSQAPALGLTLSLNGENMRVVSVSSREWDSSWHLELEPIAKR